VVPGHLQKPVAEDRVEIACGSAVEEFGGRLGALNIGELVRCLAHAWVVALTHDQYLQIGRVPGLGSNHNGLFVSYLAGGYGMGHFLTLCEHAFQCLVS